LNDLDKVLNKDKLLVNVLETDLVVVLNKDIVAIRISCNKVLSVEAIG
jgi:hypothetical protein